MLVHTHQSAEHHIPDDSNHQTFVVLSSSAYYIMSNDRMLSEYSFAKDVEETAVTARYVCPRIYWNH